MKIGRTLWISPERCLSAPVASILSSGLFSLGNLILTVSVARSEEPSQFGHYSIALMLYALIASCLRASVLESVLICSDDKAVQSRGLFESIVASTAVSFGVLAIAFVSASTYLYIVALFLPGLIAYDYLRMLAITSKATVSALACDTLWSLTTIASGVCSLFGLMSSESAIVLWCACPTLLGLYLKNRLQVSILDRARKRVASFGFAIEYLAGSGSAQLSTGLLGIWGGSVMVGAIRGAGTLYGPLNVVTASLRPVLVRRAADRLGKDGLRQGAKTVCLLAPSYIFVIVLLEFLPEWMGQQVLGASWVDASTILLPMGLESLFALITSIAFAGQRKSGDVRLMITLRTGLGLCRILSVLLCAREWGLPGAVWSMCTVSGVGAATWWLSFWVAGRRNQYLSPPRPCV